MGVVLAGGAGADPASAGCGRSRASSTQRRNDEQDRVPAPRAQGVRVCAPVDDGAGRAQRRESRASVRAGRAGGRAGLACRRGCRCRRGSGALGQERGRPQRLSGLGCRGRAGQGRDRGRDRGLAVGEGKRRLVSAAGSVRADRHADRRLRRDLPPRVAQRPVGARAEGHDVRGGAARAQGTVAGREPAQGGQGRAAPPAAGRLSVRRDRAGQGHAGRGGRGRDRRPCSRTSRRLRAPGR